MAFYEEMPLHAGEEKMRERMRVPHRDNPSIPALSQQLANHLQIAPMIAVGILDAQKRPWTTLWGGEKPLAMPMGNGIVGIRTVVPQQHDPVVEELVGTDATSQPTPSQSKGKMIGALTIDLVTRKRVKAFGRMVAGALGKRDDGATEIQLVMKVHESLGNCPKYLNSRRIEPALSQPSLVASSAQLSQRGVDLVTQADLFFVSSSNSDVDMDTNHRGGPAGYVRVAANTESGAVIVWPEYSGNRLYQTLGNLCINPSAGLCFPDFLTGDVLYVTGRTQISVGEDAARIIPRSNLCVELVVTASRLVTQALPFRGVPVPAGFSPYNPVVRPLATEKKPAEGQQEHLQQAVLISQTGLTPTISRFKFSLENAASYNAGQYVTLDLSDHLDIGYSHMRDDDPRSLNDDFVRTFTISSPPGDPPNTARQLKDDEFEITIRKVGVATEFLFKHRGDSERNKLEVGIKGFGGGFEVQQDAVETICFIAAGVGITPILPSLWTLQYPRLKLLWTIRGQDLGLVLDVLHQHPDLGPSLTVFITNANDQASQLHELQEFGATVYSRRMTQADVRFPSSKFYLCTSVPMRKQLTEWLQHKDLIFEDFNF